jgi:hypothetical protein
VTAEVIDAEGDEFRIPYDELLPDLTDPATLGCLLALVREAWGQPFASAWGTATTGKRGPYWAVTIAPPQPHTMLGHGKSEAEALVEAIERAP